MKLDSLARLSRISGAPLRLRSGSLEHAEYSENTFATDSHRKTQTGDNTNLASAEKIA
jgi:hypothetical protein